MSTSESQTDKANRLDPLGGLRGWLRLRVLWVDWERERRERVVLRSGDRMNGPRSYPYKRQKPGTYEVVLPRDVAKSIRAEPGQWRAQFGRRIAEITGCVIVGPEGDDNDRCEVAVDLESDRSQRLSPDGVFPPGTDARAHDKADTAEAKALYSEVAAAWRQLTDVRFKLLALLPIVSGIGLYQLLSQDSAFSDVPRWAKVAIAAFGVVVTVGLLIYERRNSELYGDLISRGKHLEHQLGATSGVFLGRLSGRWPVRHDVALFIIYWATLLAWLAVLVLAAAGQLDAVEG